MTVWSLQNTNPLRVLGWDSHNYTGNTFKIQYSFLKFCYSSIEDEWPRWGGGGERERKKFILSYSEYSIKIKTKTPFLEWIIELIASIFNAKLNVLPSSLFQKMYELKTITTTYASLWNENKEQCHHHGGSTRTVNGLLNGKSSVFRFCFTTIPFLQWAVIW